MIIKRQYLEPVMKWQLWILPTLSSVLFIIIAQYSFLTFHTLAELFTIIIAFVMFVLSWATFGYSRNRFLLILACGYLWIGSLDFLHMLSYKGMNLFVSDEGNTGVQFWLAARYAEAFLLLLAPVFAHRMQNKYILVVLFGGIAISLTVLIFLGYFPASFVDGVGLTPFKVNSEYVINVIFALSLFTIFRYGHDISTENKILIGMAIILTMCAELSFTFYTNIDDTANLVGHIFKLFSFWLIFHAIILTNLKKPYAALENSREELHKALAETKRANEAKSAFLANMSHDLRTPLNAIIGFSDMMRTKSFGPLGNPRYDEYANDIYDSGLLLVSLINDILDISKVEAGKYDLTEEKLDVLKLIQISFRQLSGMAEMDNHRLSVDVAPDMPRLLGDKKILIQIFNNLLSNAIKFTGEDGKIHVMATVDKENRVTITVTDTGVGMSDQEINRALRPFEQMDSTRAHKYQGSGLGLYLCVKFINILGGTLDIGSEAGKGTVVTLYFPPERTVL